MYWILSLAVILLLSLHIDLAVSSYFFAEGLFPQSSLLTFLYDYGTIPGFILLLGALASLCVSTWRREGIYLILVLVIGSGLIAHLVLKEGWPRPRPKQVMEFGGKAPYHSLFSRYIDDGHFRSFPSGHATMGYYLLALIPIGRKRGLPILTWIGFIGGATLGGLLSYTRIAQGGHFLTDTLMSLWVMALAACLLTPLLKSHERINPSTT